MNTITDNYIKSSVSKGYLQPLMDKAQKLYDDRANTAEWVEAFELRELAILWEFTCTMTPENPFGASYDDEVFDALDQLSYFGE